jgi:hypothetical protein
MLAIMQLPDRETDIEQVSAMLQSFAVTARDRPDATRRDSFARQKGECIARRA